MTFKLAKKIKTTRGYCLTFPIETVEKTFVEVPFSQKIFT